MIGNNESCWLLGTVEHAIRFQFELKRNYIKDEVGTTFKVVLKDGMKLSDGCHYIPCKFTKVSMFFFNVGDRKIKVEELEGRYIIPYSYSIKCAKKDKKLSGIYIEIYSFKLAQVHSPELFETSHGELVNVYEENSIKQLLELYMTKKSIRMFLKKKNPDKLPNLEEILITSNSEELAGSKEINEDKSQISSECKEKFKENVKNKSTNKRDKSEEYNIKDGDKNEKHKKES